GSAAARRGRGDAREWIDDRLQSRLARASDSVARRGGSGWWNVDRRPARHPPGWLRRAVPRLSARPGRQQALRAAPAGAVSRRGINLPDKLDTFSDQWAPKVVASYNGNDICVVRVEGEFVWHSHAETDDFFLVLDGELDIELRGGTVTLQPGELFVVPKGAEHRPVARKGEVKLLLIEPRGMPNMGDKATATAKVAI